MESNSLATSSSGRAIPLEPDFPLSPKGLRQRLSRRSYDLLFRSVHRKRLIYNTSWEDPRIDRELLRLDDRSKVVVITSAGCNVLDYLLDGSGEIHAVDVNPAQNALLQLKLAVIQAGDFDDLYKLFGNGYHPSFDEILTRLDGFLPSFAMDFWRAKNDYFGLTGVRKSFYYRGTAGAAAWLFQKTLLRAKKNIRQLVFDLFDAGSVEEQEEIYREIEPTLWDNLTSWLLDQPFVMTLFGVPRPQSQLIARTYHGGIQAYLRDRVRHVLTQLSTRENYFWRVYLHGSYSRSCCPNYLKEEHFDRLRERAEIVRTHDQTLANFLRENPSRYTHFVLLDHQDWLAHHAPAELEEEWRLILENSSPGSRILMRSAGLDLSFLPALARRALRFFPDWTESLHRLDRVGTYGSTHFAEVV